jgi:hypothetical protein
MCCLWKFQALFVLILFLIKKDERRLLYNYMLGTWEWPQCYFDNNLLPSRISFTLEILTELFISVHFFITYILSITSQNSDWSLHFQIVLKRHWCWIFYGENNMVYKWRNIFWLWYFANIYMNDGYWKKNILVNRKTLNLLLLKEGLGFF